MSKVDYQIKYLKYKKKYLDLKVKSNLIGGEYKNEYDPQLFLDILEENKEKIQVKDYSDKILSFDPKARHTSFSEIMGFIKRSCSSFNITLKSIDYRQRKKVIMLIPIFSDTGGGSLSKSNFWFSLLYLKTFSEEHPFTYERIKDVVLIGTSQEHPPQYFIDLINKPESYNFLLCDDGSYSGNQIKQNVIPMLMNYQLIYNKIDTVHFCFPFCVKMCREFTREEIRLRDKIKIEKIEFIYKDHGKGKFESRKIARSEKKAEKELIEKYKGQENYDDLLRIMFHPLISIRNIQYFGDFIRFHVGEKEFNKDMNHWFDHKIPDRHSFIYLTRDNQNIVESPYKINWMIKGKEVTPEINRKLTVTRNINKLLLDHSYRDEVIQSSDQLLEIPIENTSRLGAYHYDLREYHLKMIAEYEIEYDPSSDLDPYL